MKSVTHSTTSSRLRRSGFTLVELLISVALLLLLMVAVNGIFSVASRTIGTGQALAAVHRDQRAVQSVFMTDLSAAVVAPTSMPGFVIESRREVAFRNPADQLSDFDYSTTETDGALVDAQIRSLDLNGNNSDGDAGETTPVAIYNHRNHRSDKLGFFATRDFFRQTGNEGTFRDTLESDEAFIWYGHVKQPDFNQPTGTPKEFEYTDPGINLYAALSGGAPQLASNNPNNFYAADWILGRQVILLVRPDDTDGDGIGDTIYSGTPPVAQQFLIRNLPIAQTHTTGNAGPEDEMPPLGTGSRSNEPTYADQFNIAWSRYDLAGTTISQYWQIVKNYIDDWRYDASEFGEDPWYTMLVTDRFNATPQPSKPLTSAGVARTAPVLLQHCTQFMVEYAGDYLTQNRDPDGNGVPDELGDLTSPFYGAVIDANGDGSFIDPDGTIDFVLLHRGVWDAATSYQAGEYVYDGFACYRATVDVTGGTSPSGGGGAWTMEAAPRRIRWYGMPRDTAGSDTGGADGEIMGGAIFGIGGVGPTTPNALIDTVPLADVLWAAGDPNVIGGTWPAFERRLPWDDSITPAIPQVSYLSMDSDGRYTAAWGPDTMGFYPPKLIRIIVTTDDPAGRLADPQTAEYVVKLP